MYHFEATLIWVKDNSNPIEMSASGQEDMEIQIFQL